MVCRPRANSFFSTRLAIVDLPEPESPVNQRIVGFWCFSPARAVRSTSIACQWIFDARRSAKLIIPAATVALVKRSIRMKPPVSRFSS